MDQSRLRNIRPVVRVASGNFLEMYDFQVFGYYAAAIARSFFPSGNEFTSLMLSLATFGAGFMMRPVGAIVLGAYMDRRGRRVGLLITLGLMAIGTVSIACTPSYASIGLIAPMLVVLGRLVQGFRPVWRRPVFRYIFSKLRHLGRRASIQVGSRQASPWRWCSQRCWALSLHRG
jgi:MFS family permease